MASKYNKKWIHGLLNEALNLAHKTKNEMSGGAGMRWFDQEYVTEDMITDEVVEVLINCMRSTINKSEPKEK